MSTLSNLRTTGMTISPTSVDVVIPRSYGFYPINMKKTTPTLNIKPFKETYYASKQCKHVCCKNKNN